MVIYFRMSQNSVEEKQKQWIQSEIAMKHDSVEVEVSAIRHYGIYIIDYRLA